MEGYPQLATLLSTHPETRIFRRFSTSNYRNLLYLQAEIVDLEAELERFTLNDLNSGDAERKKYTRNWWKLSKRREGGKVGEQWRTMIRLRARLREYNEALLQQRQLAQFDDPSVMNLKFLTGWLTKPLRGNNTLEGLDHDTWKKGSDLLTITPTPIEDTFTRLVQKPFVKYFHRVNSKFNPPEDLENNAYVYEDSVVVKVADIIGTMVSSLLPILAILVLYFVKDLLKRLGLIALFTMLFSAALVTMTRAKRVEIFAATAAFASVQVVFVGNVD